MSNEITRDELSHAITTLNPPVLFEALGEPYFRKGHLTAPYNPNITTKDFSSAL